MLIEIGQSPIQLKAVLQTDINEDEEAAVSEAFNDEFVTPFIPLLLDVL